MAGHLREALRKEYIFFCSHLLIHSLFLRPAPKRTISIRKEKSSGKMCSFKFQEGSTVDTAAAAAATTAISRSIERFIKLLLLLLY